MRVSEDLQVSRGSDSDACGKDEGYIRVWIVMGC